jgi:hypothetical protein
MRAGAFPIRFTADSFAPRIEAAMGKFQDDTVLTEQGGRLFATLSRDWEIWGPNGGYVAAIALRAAGKIAPAGHGPATISVQYLSVAQFADVEAVVEPVPASTSRRGFTSRPPPTGCSSTPIPGSPGAA